MPADQPATSAASATSAATKPWWRSRVLWFNLVVALLAAAEVSLQLLQAVLPVNAYAALAFVLAVGNAGLRVITSARLTRGAPEPEARDVQ